MKKIAISIENKVRELDGVIWLTLNLINSNHEVVIGPHESLISSLHRLHPDVFMPTRGVNLNKMDEAGIAIFHILTEGLRIKPNRKILCRFSEVQSHAHKYLFWGEDQAIAEGSLLYNSDIYEITGHPRFDLLRDELIGMYHASANRLNRQFGNYVLVNTNFGYNNGYLLEDSFGGFALDSKFAGLGENKFLEESVHQHAMMAAVSYLAMRLNSDIILRPHPGEDDVTYKRNFDMYDNVHVIREGDVRDWICGAGVVIHHDCTTGVESALSGTPTVAYSPLQNHDADHKFPHQLSDTVAGLEELHNKVSGYLDAPEYSLDQRQRNLVNGRLNMNHPPAAAIIVKLVDELEEYQSQDSFTIRPAYKREIEELMKSLLPDKFIEMSDASLLRVGHSRAVNRRKRMRQKFPGLSACEIFARAELMQQQFDLPNIEVSKIKTRADTYMISQA